MEGDRAELGADAKTAPTSNRFTSPLVINSVSRRNSLFARPTMTDGNARPMSVASASDGNAASPNNTRIPRPTSQRRPFSISDAYRMAEEEEAAQGSPSPAPRSWRSAGKKLQKPRSPSTSILLQRKASSSVKPLETGNGDGGGDSNGERPVSSQQSDNSDSTFDEKLRQFERDHGTPEDPSRVGGAAGLLSRSRIGSRIVESGKELLSRKSSRNSLDGSSSPRSTKGVGPSPSFLRRLSIRKRESSDVSSLAREPHEWMKRDENAPLQPSPTPPRRPATALSGSQTPDRSFAWQTDADFTAGDLQISNSPPVAIGRKNTKIDEIRALEAEVNERFSQGPNNRQSEIDSSQQETRQETGFQAGLERRDSAIATTEDAKSEDEGRSSPPSRPVSRAGVRLDELRSREIESLSRRALATARLDEFRGRNIGVSRSPSPDVARRSGQEPVRAFSPLRERLRRQMDEAPVSETPVESDKTDQKETLSPALFGRADINLESVNEVEEFTGPAQTLRQLATAGARGQAPDEAQKVSNDPAPTVRGGRLTERLQARRSLGFPKSDSKPTVGFTGLSRSSSVESRRAKRRSFVHSDSDPTDRIEGEMQLFAPQENQSERGSMRAPSPESEPEPETAEKTPKPARVDPLSQPTPRVTGAYVETPAIVKTEKPENLVPGAGDCDAVGVQESDSKAPSTERDDGSTKHSTTPGEKEDTSPQRKRRAQSSKGDGASSRSSSLSTRRRARSLSRGRAPLQNSSKPPTVKDDLLEIQRANQIEDSTMDDIGDLLNNPSPLNPTLSTGPAGKPEPADKVKKSSKPKELGMYDRMNQTLEASLHNIQSAKQGIERLESRVAQVELKELGEDSVHSRHIKGKSSPCPACRGLKPAAGAEVTYIHLPLPRLWYRRPNFRFTLLGLGLFLLTLWYAAESLMCLRYCKPEHCYPNTPCEWSSEDPSWGYAIPAKLDQWVAGGRGKELAHRLQPDVSDWLADIRDAVTGIDIASVDTSRYTWEQNRQYRRRLAKRGMTKPFVERPEDRALFSGWRSARMADDRARSAEEMGYAASEDEWI
ncbi:hypothetical protein B0J18DRAFT_126485 [Chaetomium sp. MPI-SDFR-AT-0129]|nr:hypothetical protein B0J18DRAFT_126485 [Chaetomium sp. MPI-SDFR-AT-0129]